MLGLISLLISATIFVLLGITSVLEDTEDVRWLPLGFFFLVLGLILGAAIPERWRGRVP